MDNMQRPKDLNHFILNMKKHFGGLLAPGRETIITRAPARLDIMGGIADYSGSLVIESILQEATLVAIQKRKDRRIIIKSLNLERLGFDSIVDSNLDIFFKGDKPKEYEAFRKEMSANPRQSWKGYVLGCYLVLLREGLATTFTEGATIAITSNIPVGAGMSSSGALEIATMLAMNHAYNLKLKEFQMTRACQMVENYVVGVACGIMDQVTCLFGEQDKLLPLKCQPHEISAMIPVPSGIQFVGVHTGAPSNTARTNYNQTRTATFMGRKIIFANKIDSSGHLPPYGGFLCNVSEEEWETLYKKMVPARMTGKEFQQKYRSHDDPATKLEPDHLYRPKSRTEHSIKENVRAHRLVELLQNYANDAQLDHLVAAGELMFQSHHSYDKNCGLGTKNADVLVDLVKGHGPTRGVYGARVTEGGSGATIVILASQEANDMIETIAAQYFDLTARQAQIFWGSSPGAREMGVTITQFD